MTESGLYFFMYYLLNQERIFFAIIGLMGLVALFIKILLSLISLL